ncbi:hypothetical protein Rhe02_36060 [Rhizocola hellebori]|uniref:Uncharacterized protein n=1 Tax=Rhizocola hellebori TaxID=1392758 RepID=A0A8J3Q8S2_9ACTN|nr:hypothetical protein Rhe02_36060 [Rhizocola hellebori]
MLFLLAGPFMLGVVCLTAMIAVSRLSPIIGPIELSRWLWGFAAMSLLASIVIGRWWGARSVLAGPAALAVGLGLSVSASFLMMHRAINSYREFSEQLRLSRVWVPALFVMVYLVARAAQRGWGGRVMLVVVPAWLVVLDVVIMVQFWHSIGADVHAPGGYMFVKVHAPMWFLAALAYEPLGLVNPEEMVSIRDDSVFTPHFLIVLAAYALSYATAAIRASKAAAKAAVATTT